MPQNLILEMKNICKAFPGVEVFDCFGFDLREGEIHCVVGENGAGKSTLIMKKLAIEYPVYKWEKNKGYPTKQHRESIKHYGTSPFHRKKFLRKLYDEIQLELTRTPAEVR